MVMQINLSGIAEYLVTNNILNFERIQQLTTNALQNKQSIVECLIKSESANSKNIAQAIAKYFALQFIDLENFNISNTKLDLLNLTLVRKYQVLPLELQNNKLLLAIADPTNTVILNALKFHTNKELILAIAEQNKISHWINILSTEKQYLELQLSKEKDSQKNHTYSHILLTNDEIADKDDTPIIKFVDQILNDAITKGASDIHFEPYEKFYRIRFRIDGILYEITKSDISLSERFSARLKVMAKLDIAEKRLPQDGRFTLNISDKFTRDCRISICPTLFGEKLVIRILNPNHILLQIDHLGVDSAQKQLFFEHIQAPQGMILVTGPTGSGKTVTLYTALNQLNMEDKNISAVEDPIEINLAGINQVEVNPKIGLDFAAALRTFLRQDPDVIMVGEIRDSETAEIAIKASQTGHLVLSTLHTNSAASTLTRLVNMGIATFNIASSVSLVIAQRLVRRLCDHCKQEKIFPDKTLIEAGFDLTKLSNNILFTPQGCNKCKNGYCGRIGIFEFLPITKNIAQIIMQHCNTLAIENTAQQSGMLTLRENALNKAILGLTSLAEVNRAILS